MTIDRSTMHCCPLGLLQEWQLPTIPMNRLYICLTEVAANEDLYRSMLVTIHCLAEPSFDSSEGLARQTKSSRE